MCGIYLTFNPDLFSLIKHRGITSEIHEIPEIFMHACHTRLPIQTLEGDGFGQPIVYDDGSVLMFNGEIFNFDKEKYSCDTEYLTDFFKKNNTFDKIIRSSRYIEGWDGMWSILFISMKDRSAIAFTDPLGKKQLYINDNGEISSEIKNLGIEDRETDPVFLSSVRKWGYNSDNRTPYLGVKRLLPNKIYRFPFSKLGGLDPDRYESFDEYFDFFPDCSHSPIYDLLSTSIKNRLITKKYPIAMLLSGGLDSTIVTYFLERVFQADVKYYSIKNQEDEDHVKICRDYFGIDVNFLEYDMKSNQELIDHIYHMNDYPIDLGSVVPQWHLFKSISDQTDCKIVISGDGADELFGGYRRINDYDSQGSDVFEELTFYHLPRLDRMSMSHTLELRSPFLSHELVRAALSLPFEYRKNKKILKETFRGKIPDEIIDRKKIPLKNPMILDDKISYRNRIVDRFLETVHKVKIYGKD